MRRLPPPTGDNYPILSPGEKFPTEKSKPLLRRLRDWWSGGGAQGPSIIDVEFHILEDEQRPPGWELTPDDRRQIDKWKGLR